MRVVAQWYCCVLSKVSSMIVCLWVTFVSGHCVVPWRSGVVVGDHVWDVNLICRCVSFSCDCGVLAVPFRVDVDYGVCGPA